MADGEASGPGDGETAADLRQRVDDLERFANRLAHELTTPLVTIRGFSRLLADRGGWDAMTGDAIDRIERSAGRAERIIHALLDETRAGISEQLAIGPLVVETVAGVEDEHDDITVQVALAPDTRAFAAAASVRTIVANVLLGLAARVPAGPVHVTIASTDAAAADTVALRFVTAGPPFSEQEQRVIDGAHPGDDAAGMELFAAASATASSQAGRLWCGAEESSSGIAVVLALPRAG